MLAMIASMCGLSRGTLETITNSSPELSDNRARFTALR